MAAAASRPHRRSARVALLWFPFRDYFEKLRGVPLLPPLTCGMEWILQSHQGSPVGAHISADQAVVATAAPPTRACLCSTVRVKGLQSAGGSAERSGCLNEQSKGLFSRSFHASGKRQTMNVSGSEILGECCVYTHAMEVGAGAGTHGWGAGAIENQRASAQR